MGLFVKYVVFFTLAFASFVLGVNRILILLMKRRFGSRAGAGSSPDLGN